MDQEIWRDIACFDKYQISSNGNVRTSYRVMPPDEFKPRALYFNKQGYATVQLRKNGSPKNFLVHRLVAEAFVGPRPTPDHFINHKNGIKSDNRPENLEWTTLSDNANHAFITGLNPGQVKYWVYCKTLSIKTLGCYAMARQLDKLGYKLTVMGIWRCVSGRTKDYKGLEFTSEKYSAK